MQCVLVADDRVRSLALTSLLMDILDDAGGGAAFVAWGSRARIQSVRQLSWSTVLQLSPETAIVNASAS